MADLTKAPVQKAPLLKLGCTLPFEDLEKYGPVFLNYNLRPEVLLTASDVLSSSSGHRCAVRELARKCGGCTVHAPFISMFWDDVDSEMQRHTEKVLMTSAEVCAELGADSSVIHTNFDSRLQSHDEWLSKKVKGLAKVTEYYVELGVRPLIENVRESSPETLLKTRAELHHETGICIDPGHAAVISEHSALDWFKAVKPYLGEIHLHNNHGDFDAHLPVDRGSGWNAHSVLKTLIEEGYTFFPVMEPKDHDTAVKSIQALTRWGLR